MSMSIGNSAFFLITMTMAILLCTISGSFSHALGKRNIGAAENNAVDYPDYKLKKPMTKRAALLLDRLLVALQKVVDNDELGKGGVSGSYVNSLQDYPDISDSPRMQLGDEKTMDLQRRGQAKGRVYWRCYFNAVTCFKRK
ncbi:uncharacterized protein LOC131666202 [Phymastichus coffea]|uniref:uncharacterized protein LOC131666202 n=1 Tax=Phymastichus coffea TaxID=108790 RepID=UPI00273C5FEB|nr:uncharacterized protein LOC131666202 [Phymastichus coffea]